MYLEKLRMEVMEYQSREDTYNEKREELLQIEKAFRNVHDRLGDNRQTNHCRDETNDDIIKGLKDQIADFDRKRVLIQGARMDLKNKVNEIKSTIRQRENEIEELKNVIKGKRNNTEFQW